MRVMNNLLQSTDKLIIRNQETFISNKNINTQTVKKKKLIKSFLLPNSYQPDIFEQEIGFGRVLNSAEWKQHGVRHLQGMAGDDGTETHLEAAIFTLKLNAVFILTLYRAVR